jgi:hypothetical protein
LAEADISRKMMTTLGAPSAARASNMVKTMNLTLDAGI